LSAQAPVTIGVPQGSILGPLAFILFINDLPKTVKYSEVHMYADDTVVLFSSGNPDTIKDRLNAINIWFSLSKLSLNIS